MKPITFKAEITHFLSVKLINVINILKKIIKQFLFWICKKILNSSANNKDFVECEYSCVDN